MVFGGTIVARLGFFVRIDSLRQRRRCASGPSRSQAQRRRFSIHFHHRVRLIR
jgi:hypothetical protein